MTPLRHLVAALSLSVALGLAACAAPGGPTPTQPGPTPSTGPLVAPCADFRPASARIAASHPVPASAALLSATIVVQSVSSGPPSCTVLVPGSTVHLPVGSSVELVANAAPSLSHPDVVTVSTRPGPVDSGPGGGPPTGHSIVRLTAAAAGTTTVTWFDCSGTGC